MPGLRIFHVVKDLSILFIGIPHVCGAWDRFRVGVEIVLVEVLSHGTYDHDHRCLKSPTHSQMGGISYPCTTLRCANKAMQEDISLIHLGWIDGTRNGGKGGLAVDIFIDLISLALRVSSSYLCTSVIKNYVLSS